MVPRKGYAAQVFGGQVVRAPKGAMHGKTSLVYHHNTGLMKVQWRSQSILACISLSAPFGPCSCRA